MPCQKNRSQLYLRREQRSRRRFLMGLPLGCSQCVVLRGGVKLCGQPRVAPEANVQRQIKRVSLASPWTHWRWRLKGAWEAKLWAIRENPSHLLYPDIASGRRKGTSRNRRIPPWSSREHCRRSFLPAVLFLRINASGAGSQSVWRQLHAGDKLNRLSPGYSTFAIRARDSSVIQTISMYLVSVWCMIIVLNTLHNEMWMQPLI